MAIGGESLDLNGLEVEVGTLAIGGVAVTATAAELNAVDGITATVAELNILDGVTATAAEINNAADVSAKTELVTATEVLTSAKSGKTLVVNSATSVDLTLPAVALGLEFRVIIGPLGVTNAQNHRILVPGGANLVFGGATVAGADVPASAEDAITFVGTSGTTSLPGDWIELVCDGTNWNVNGRGTTTGSITFTAAL